MFNILKKERWAEYLSSQKRQGITLERDFLQTSPEGDLFISYWQAEDIQKSMMVMMASKDPFDVWLKQQYENFSGMNMDHPLPRLSSRILFYCCPLTRTQPKNQLKIIALGNKKL